MKKKILLLSLLVLAAFSYGQITLETNAQLIVSSGSTVIASDGIVNNGGVIDNAGTIEIKGDLENNTSALMTSTNTGTVKFNGSAAQKITGTADADFYGTVEINNANGVSIDTTAAGAGSNQTINGTLAFTAGLFTLNWFDLTLTADATGAAAGKYVQTDSVGVVVREVLADSSATVFPIGKSAYNPVTLHNTGTVDNFGARVVDTVDVTGSTDHFVDRSWIVSEEISGGSALTVVPQWNVAEELTGFDRNNCDVNLAVGAGINEFTPVGPATTIATGIYAKDGSTFSSVGVFEVSDYFNAGISFDLQLMLAGAYNGTNMNKDLNTGTPNLIPLTDPYGLSTTVAAIPTDAVDWIKIELRDKTDHAIVLQSFARFVDINGQVIEEDGTNFKITGTALDDYFVAIHHRNHFGVVSTATINLDVTSPAYNFSSGIGQAWDDTGVTTNDAMKNVGGVFCLWDGDANNDGDVAYNGGSNDRLAVLGIVGSGTPGSVVTNTYDNTDVNMDGNVSYNGGGNDRLSILGVVGSGTPGVVYHVHLP